MPIRIIHSTTKFSMSMLLAISIQVTCWIIIDCITCVTMCVYVIPQLIVLADSPANNLYKRSRGRLSEYITWSFEPDLSKFRPVAIDVRWTGLFTAQNVAENMAEGLTRKKRVRGGHRASATRVISQADEAIRSGLEPGASGFNMAALNSTS